MRITMRVFCLLLLLSSALWGVESRQIIPTPEQEIEMIEACGKKSTVSFSEALRELIPGAADEYFDENYLHKIEKIEAEKFDGEYKDYWENGQLRTRVTFVKGIPDGHFHGWYPNGGEAFKGYLDMGKKQGIHMSFFYKEPVYKERSEIRRLLFYNEEGQLHGRQQANYLYHLKATVHFFNGKKDGKLSLYNDKFKLYSEKSFKEGKEIPAPTKK